MDTIAYAIEPTLSPDEFIDVLILLAAPDARSYYPHIGMTPHDSCWIIPRVKSS